MSQEEFFSIRQIVDLTGLSEFTIRGWENRYSAFSPNRSETGRREYSKNDVERALLLRELLKRGHKISKIAKLSNQKLKDLFELADLKNEGAHQNSKFPTALEAIELMALQKWPELENHIKKIKSKNASELIHRFFLPTLQLLSQQVHQGLISISQEHVLSSFLKEKIYLAISEIQKKNKNEGIRFILAAPEGDHHEIGLLMAHLLIRSFGYTSLYLGPHTPSKDLAETALRFDANFALIVTTASKKGGARQDAITYVSEIQKRAGSNLKILLAGSQSPSALGDQPSLSILKDFSALEELLKKMEGNHD